ncbi:hypothetical protein NHG34_05305 [Aerococcaceae bacterium NML190938]|nr:hypothetical protein [Aerococcaceae bacterium NML190938]
MSKRTKIEIVARLGAIVVLTIIATIQLWLPPTITWLKNAKPPEVEQVETSSVEEVAPPTAEQLEQEKLLEQVKKAGGSSVLLRTEKVGDNVKPVTVRHWARYTEIGTVDFWQEVVTIE